MAQNQNQAVERVLSFAKKVREDSVRGRPTILVVSPAGFKDNLRDALLVTNKEQCKDFFQFVFCEHVEDVLGYTAYNRLSSVDFIVIVLDPRESTCVTWAEDNIQKVDSTYIEAGRLCFVNGACSLPPAEKGIPLGHINVVSQKYSIILINGDILKPEKCLILASRILQLVSVTVGVETGVPMSVDIPGYLLADYAESN